jgi:nitrite reductase (NADH) large subunit
MPQSRYVIIGNGVAGITAAQEIRHADPQGHVLLIGDEPEPYYYRASLSEWISGQTSDEMLPGRTELFYRHMRFEQVRGHATQVDPESRTIHLAEDRTLSYDKLLIATGARANVHPVAGLDENDVLAFRTLDDARQIKERLGCCGRALIVGGGILGLELAGALHKMGIQHIAIVQRTPPIGKPLLDAPAAEWLQERIRADGVDLFISDTVERVQDRMAYFRSGRNWDFDILVQAIGIAPIFPQVPGLIVGRGIRIDERCRTNLPGIYAAGDCTETRVCGSEHWQVTRIWLDCAHQGKTAGRNMAGRDAILPDRPFFNASVIYTIFYTYAGEPHGEGGDVHVWQAEEGYRKIRVVDGRLAGALLLGERHGTMALYETINRPVAQFGAGLARLDFPFNDLTGQDWDYMFY